jgi:hypothetical protein
MITASQLSGHSSTGAGTAVCSERGRQFRSHAYVGRAARAVSLALIRFTAALPGLISSLPR